MRRLALAVALATSACSRSELPGSLPHQEEIPPGAAAIYLMIPLLLEYDYLDSTRTDPLRLAWVYDPPDHGFEGFNCLAFTPRTPSDTVGTFVFVARGANAGWVERSIPSVTDTVVGYFLRGHEGSRGTYSMNSQGVLTLLWSNGTQTDYFDPTAQIRISGDTVWSEARFSLQGDSVTGGWKVAWLRLDCPA